MLFPDRQKTDNKAKEMKPQARTRFTLSLLTAGILCASTATWAANVPAGTQLADKQELVRNNGNEPVSYTHLRAHET